MKKLTKRTFSNFLVVCALTFLFSNSSFAQGNIQRIFDDNSDSGNLRTSVNIPDELLHGHNPTIYIENSRVINVTGDESPKVLQLLDANSNLLLQGNNSLYNSVEVITITLGRISDLNNRLDLSRINGFTSLRYVYIKCLFDCTDQQINNYLLNADSVTTVFYKVVNPS